MFFVTAGEWWRLCHCDRSQATVDFMLSRKVQVKWQNQKESKKWKAKLNVHVWPRLRPIYSWCIWSVCYMCCWGLRNLPVFLNLHYGCHCSQRTQSILTPPLPPVDRCCYCSARFAWRQCRSALLKSLLYCSHLQKCGTNWLLRSAAIVLKGPGCKKFKIALYLSGPSW